MTSESKRIKNFRKWLTKAVPRFPNDKETLVLLEEKHLVDQLIIFLNWRVRFVAPRKRTVLIEKAAANDPRWTSLFARIDALLNKVKDGEDLTPYLSRRAITKGFSPETEKNEPNADHWADKDFLLNVMGLHHFHLVPCDGASEREAHNDVLFASVSREQFEVIGIFNHEVFESTVPGSMAAERAQLWRIFEEREQRGALPGQLLFGGMGGLGITLSGHSATLVRAAQRYYQRIREIDPQLDDQSFIKDMFSLASVPAKPKFQWRLNYLDLGVLDESSGTFFIYAKGPN